MSTRASIVSRLLGLVLVFLLLGACSTNSAFWDRSPRVASARQVGPGDEPGALPYAEPQPRYEPRQEPRYEPRQEPRYAPPSAAAPAPAQAPPTADTSGMTAEEGDVLARVNGIRAQRSLRPLRFQPALYVAASEHSLEQQHHGYMGHGSPDPGRASLAQRMALAGYEGSVYAEVVAWGYTCPAGVVEGWMNSTDHRRILVDPELTEAAFCRVGQYWTGNFGAPRRFPTGRPPASAAPRARAAPAPRATPAPRRRAPSPRKAQVRLESPPPATGFG